MKSQTLDKAPILLTNPQDSLQVELARKYPNLFQHTGKIPLDELEQFFADSEDQNFVQRILR